MFNDLFDQIAKWRHITIQKFGVRKIMIRTDNSIQISE